MAWGGQRRAGGVGLAVEEGRVESEDCAVGGVGAGGDSYFCVSVGEGVGEEEGGGG